MVIDELPTIYFRGLDNLIATARSNKVARMSGFSGFQPAKARLQRQGSRRDSEYRGQYLQRTGRRRNGPDALRTIRKDRAEATVREHQPQRYLDVDKYPARQSYSCVENLDALAGRVRRGCGATTSERRSSRRFSMPGSSWTTTP